MQICYHDEFIHRPDFRKQMKPHFELDPNVLIMSLFPGFREDLMRYIINTPGLRAIVMRTYGSGNAPQSPWLISALREAYQRGKVIINISQCLQGRVEMGRYDTGYQLQEAGVISGYDGTVESAVTKLMYLQGKYKDSEQVRKFMRQSICGEITV